MAGPAQPGAEVVIGRERPTGPDGRALIAGSEAALREVYTPEECFTLDAAELEAPGIDFLVARDAASGAALGCVALVGCDGYGEIKRLFVRPEARGRGVGDALMQAAEARARDRGFALVRLETGPRLAAAVALYRRRGYRERGPFGDYAPHPASLFMEKAL
ncbi:MAG: GNAT family N-acetyltransferase [Alphaproteobacteria bacterium]|nr:MAG: GNAT family N-acetyltransferase [Alphaproteobacteria bacterium]